MANTSERRRVARFPILSHFSSLGQEPQQVHVCDLSPEGACIEHFRPLPDWDICFVELPPALGGIRLQGEVVWSRRGGRKPVAEGKERVYYQSGLHFALLTSEQRAGLTRALEILKATQEAPPSEQPSGPTGEAPGARGETATDRE